MFLNSICFAAFVAAISSFGQVAGQCVENAEIVTHDTPNDCWQVIGPKVYDFTNYLNRHPGGAGEMTPYCGEDATSAFVAEGGHDADMLASRATEYEKGTACSGAPLPAPSPSPSPACFSGNNVVQVEGSGLTHMKDVKIGDRVKDSSGGFSRVYSFAHKLEDIVTSFLQIHVEDCTIPLEISKVHMMFANGKTVQAKYIKVGDLVGGKNEPTKRVKSINMVERKGVYAPLTESGDIEVSGLAASCYVSMLDASPGLQGAFMHSILSFRRMYCMLDSDGCKNESYNDLGYSDALWYLISIGFMVSKLDTWMQTAILYAASPILFLPMIEQMIPFISIVFILSVGWNYFGSSKGSEVKQI